VAAAFRLGAVSLLKDIGWVLVGVLLAPALLTLALAGVAVVVARHVYWWASGNQPMVPALELARVRVRRAS
jgi:hypothetical protein